MNLLVTAGNTQVFIDKVRCLTNVFTGRTGAAIALEAFRRGHRVTLLTSHPETSVELKGNLNLEDERWQQLTYKTIEDLRLLMDQHLRHNNVDSVIHSAAVSDYRWCGLHSDD